MIELLKKSVTSKEFYKSGYKGVSRSKTITFLVFISLLYSLFVAPVFTYNNYKQFNLLKEEVQEIPSGVEIAYENNELSTNVNRPVVIDTSENTLLVIDAKSNYTEHQANKTEIVFRKNGFIIYQNGEEVDRNSYRSLPGLEIMLTGESLKSELEALHTGNFLGMAAIFNLIVNFISAIFNILAISVIFGIIAYTVRLVLKRKTTPLLQIKRILFLGSFLIIGMIINAITLGLLPLADIILLGVGYLYLVRD